MQSGIVLPAAGLLFFPLIMVGFLIHCYPDIAPTDAQQAKWMAGIDLNTFKLGVYIEALGSVLFLPFAAWLFGRLKQRWPRLVACRRNAGCGCRLGDCHAAHQRIVGRAG